MSDIQSNQSTSTIQNETHTTKTFAQAAKSSTNQNLSDTTMIFPKKDQGIILSPEQGIPTADYTISLGKLIEPSKILFISRISFNRICAYLTSKNDVDKLMSTHNHIVVHDKIIPIRRLVMPAKRIVITGGSPIIPHIEIEKVLKSHQIKLVSGVNFIGAGMKIPGFQHVRTFNRQFYANLEENEEIPKTITVSYDGDNYRLFLALSETCFHCHKTGHKAIDCTQNQQPQPTKETNGPSISQIDHITQLENQSEIQENAVSFPSPIETNTKTETQPNSSSKRSLSNSSDLESITNNPPETKPSEKQNSSTEVVESDITPSNQTENLKKTKRVKLAPKPKIAHLQDIMNAHPSDYILSYNNLSEFIKKSVGNRNIFELSKKYVKDPKDMSILLQSLYHHLEDRAMKCRFTKLSKILENSKSQTDIGNRSSMSTSTDDNDE